MSASESNIPANLISSQSSSYTTNLASALGVGKKPSRCGLHGGTKNLPGFWWDQGVPFLNSLVGLRQYLNLLVVLLHPVIKQRISLPIENACCGDRADDGV